MGKARREADESAEVAVVVVAAAAAVVVRAEEGSRWRTSVLNLRSALGRAARTLADGISARLGCAGPFRAWRVLCAAWGPGARVRGEQTAC